jgi:D-sedoheptulose 7-phosphate isomerase
MNPLERPAPSTDHLSRVANLLDAVSRAEIRAMAEALDRARRSGDTVFLLGNGGSGATALHLGNDLARTARPGVPALRAHCLVGNPSLVSALANDFGYDQVFVRQLKVLCRPTDVVLGISGSGKSANCLAALEHARAIGAATLGLLGFDGGPMKRLCDLSVHVPSYDYLEIEDAHLSIAHSLVHSLRHEL